MRTLGIVLRTLESMDFGTKLVLCIIVTLALFVVVELLGVLTNIV